MYLLEPLFQEGVVYWARREFLRPVVCKCADDVAGVRVHVALVVLNCPNVTSVPREESLELGEDLMLCLNAHGVGGCYCGLAECGCLLCDLFLC